MNVQRKSFSILISAFLRQRGVSDEDAMDLEELLLAELLDNDLISFDTELPFISIKDHRLRVKKSIASRYFKSVALIGRAVNDPIPYVQVAGKLNGWSVKMKDGALLHRTSRETNSFRDISHLFDMGLVVSGGYCNDELGEIVINKTYFDCHLSKHYSSSRVFLQELTSSDAFNEASRQALSHYACRYIPYSSLPSWEGSIEDLEQDFVTIYNELTQGLDYLLKGLMITPKNPLIKSKVNNHLVFSDFITE